MGARHPRAIARGQWPKASASAAVVLAKGRVIPLDDAAQSFLRLVGCESLIEHFDLYAVKGEAAKYSNSIPYLEEREFLTLLAAIAALQRAPRRLSARQLAAQLAKKSPRMVAGWRGHAHGSLYARFVGKVVANYYRAGLISPTSPQSPN